MNKKNVPDLVGLGQFFVRKGTDWKPKVLIALALTYLFFPVELLPDAIPVLGVLDDAGIMALALWWLSYATKQYNISLLSSGEASPPAELEEHQPPLSVIDTKGTEVKEEAKVEIPDLEK